MRLIWTPYAASDLGRLQAFIYPHNPLAARRAVKRLREGAKILKTFPHLGRQQPDADEGYREYLITFGASVYVLNYYATDTQVTILAIRHGRESDNEEAKFPS